MFADRITRKKGEAVAPTQQGAQLMPGTHPREFAAFEDSEEFHVGLGKGARDMLCLRTRLRDDAVTDESPEINLLRLENTSVECRNGWRRTCRCRSFVSEKSGRFHKSLL